MPSFNKSDYALNKNSECIRYRSSNGEITEISKEKFLQENPTNTEEKFTEIKELSDALFEEEMKGDTQQVRTRKKQDKSVGVVHLTNVNEDNLIHQEEIETVQCVLKKLLNSKVLTSTQERRFKLHYLKGESYRKIATSEGVHFTSVQESIIASRKKLIKYFNNFG